MPFSNRGTHEVNAATAEVHVVFCLTAPYKHSTIGLDDKKETHHPSKVFKLTGQLTVRPVGGVAATAYAFVTLYQPKQDGLQVYVPLRCLSGWNEDCSQSRVSFITIFTNSQIARHTRVHPMTFHHT